jgi:hypothetical protein
MASNQRFASLKMIAMIKRSGAPEREAADF